jgi:hypothetical protein
VTGYYGRLGTSLRIERLPIEEMDRSRHQRNRLAQVGRRSGSKTCSRPRKTIRTGDQGNEFGKGRRQKFKTLGLSTFGFGRASMWPNKLLGPSDHGRVPLVRLAGFSGCWRCPLCMRECWGPDSPGHRPYCVEPPNNVLSCAHPNHIPSMTHSRAIVLLGIPHKMERVI